MLKRDWYALSDTEQNKHLGAFKINVSDAPRWNKKNFGIFWTVQDIIGDRKKENVARINSWAVDIDGGNKEEQMERICKLAYPSMVVETKNGYHVYWNAKDGTIENYEAIVLDRLVDYYKADKKARDLCRILRVPGFLHQKNPKEPFLIREIWKHNVSYTEDQMLSYFKVDEKTEFISKAKQELRKNFKVDGDDFWEKIYNIDCEAALNRLSGSSAVGCERFTFKRVANGNLNILVDGKSTSCWIDQDKRIGSLDGGGPTVWQWINWYQRNNKRTYDFMKSEFPELWQS